MTSMTADQILRAARESNPGRPFGSYTHGAVCVAYDRPLKRYEVGTCAQVLAIGKRADMVATIHAILDGAAYTPSAVAAYRAAHA